MLSLPSRGKGMESIGGRVWVKFRRRGAARLYGDAMVEDWIIHLENLQVQSKDTEDDAFILRGASEGADRATFSPTRPGVMEL